MGSWAKSAHFTQPLAQPLRGFAHKGTSTRPAKPGLVDGKAEKASASSSEEATRRLRLRVANMPPAPPPIHEGEEKGEAGAACLPVEP